MTLAADTVAGHLRHAGLLWGALTLLPQTLELIKTVKLAHVKPGTVF
jgi:hypothetical protein